MTKRYFRVMTGEGWGNYYLKEIDIKNWQPVKQDNCYVHVISGQVFGIISSHEIVCLEE